MASAFRLAYQPCATAAMTDDTPLPFDLPAVRRKKLTVDFDGGNQSSDAGLLLLREAERELGVCRRLAEAMPDRRDPDRIQHAMFEMVMARVMAIACGHEDAIDLDDLRHDPLMKVAVGALSGERRAAGLAIDHQPAGECAKQDRCGAAHGRARRPVRHHGDAGSDGDVDDTFCVAHGGQQLAFWNAHHDERGFAPMHIYHAGSGAPVVAILRPARTPKGTEVRTVIKHVTKHLRRHWPTTRIVWRGDGHYGRVEAMDWADETTTSITFSASPVMPHSMPW